MGLLLKQYHDRSQAENSERNAKLADDGYMDVLQENYDGGND